MNVTVNFTAVPWDSRANLTWMVVTEEGKHNFNDVDIGASYTVTRRLDYKLLQSCLGSNQTYREVSQLNCCLVSSL